MFDLIQFTAKGETYIVDELSKTITESILRLLSLWCEETDPTITYAIKESETGKVVATASSSPGGYAVITQLVPKVRVEVYNVQFRRLGNKSDKSGKIVMQYEFAVTKNIHMPKRLTAGSPIWDEEKHEPSTFGESTSENSSGGIGQGDG